MHCPTIRQLEAHAIAGLTQFEQSMHESIVRRDPEITPNQVVSCRRIRQALLKVAEIRILLEET